MRFRRADLPGLLLATAVPPGLLLLVFAGYDLWDHHGSPLLPTIAVHLAIAAGVIGALSRFVRNWGVVGTLIGLLLATIAAAIVMDQTGNGGTAVDRSLRLLATGLFLLVNIVVVREVVWYGVGPWLERRDERRAAQESAQGSPQA